MACVLRAACTYCGTWAKSSASVPDWRSAGWCQCWPFNATPLYGSLPATAAVGAGLASAHATGWMTTRTWAFASDGAHGRCFVAVGSGFLRSVVPFFLLACFCIAGVLSHAPTYAAYCYWSSVSLPSSLLLFPSASSSFAIPLPPPPPSLALLLLPFASF